MLVPMSLGTSHINIKWPWSLYKHCPLHVFLLELLSNFSGSRGEVNNSLLWILWQPLEIEGAGSSCLFQFWLPKSTEGKSQVWGDQCRRKATANLKKKEKCWPWKYQLFFLAGCSTAQWWSQREGFTKANWILDTGHINLRKLTFYQEEPEITI